MKFTKTMAFAGASLGAIIIVAALSGGTSAIAQTPAATPAAKAATPTPTAASASSNIPRHAGTFSGAKVDSMTYVPSCPAFKISMDAAAIQESNSRAFVEGEARRFEGLRDTFDAYQDCLLENGRRDIDVVRTKLGDTLSGASTRDVEFFNGLNAAAQGSVERIGKMPAPKAPKAPRGGAPAAAAVAAVTPTTTPLPDPTGRFIGTLVGAGDTLTYTSACPGTFGAMSGASFTSAASRDEFNRLLDDLRVLPNRIRAVANCRQDNGQKDFETTQDVINAGVNALYVPSANAFNREYEAVRFQLNEHRKPGGLLAPPELSRPKAAPTKAKAKAKKK